MRGLRETALSRGRSVRVYFLSASPPQIGRAIRRKLELDGIVYDGIVFKNQLQRLMRGKFRHLREQVGYKLTELLKARRAEPRDGARVSVRRRLGVGSADLLALRRRRRRAASTPPSSTALLRAVARRSAADRASLRSSPRRRPSRGGGADLHQPRAADAAGALARLRRRGWCRASTIFQTAACLFDDDVLSAAGVMRGRALADRGLRLHAGAAGQLARRRRAARPSARRRAAAGCATHLASRRHRAAPRGAASPERWRALAGRRGAGGGAGRDADAVIDYRTLVGLEMRRRGVANDRRPGRPGHRPVARRRRAHRRGAGRRSSSPPASTSSARSARSTAGRARSAATTSTCC